MAERLRERLVDCRGRLDDSAATGGDEVLDLQIDRRSDVVGAKTEIATIADDWFPARACVVDFGRCSAVDVRAVEHRHHRVAVIDRAGVG